MKNNLANPYLAGFLLGVVLIISYLILGVGLGASSGPARVSAALCDRVCNFEYFASWGETPLHYYLVAMVGGIIIGGFVSAWGGRRIEWTVERGRYSSIRQRLLWSFVGGILVGFAARLAQGCTSGQALSGGALLINGSLVFMICVFVGGFATAHFFRRQWQ